MSNIVLVLTLSIATQTNVESDMRAFNADALPKMRHLHNYVFKGIRIHSGTNFVTLTATNGNIYLNYK